jgi:hypothetical protein
LICSAPLLCPVINPSQIGRTVRKFTRLVQFHTCPATSTTRASFRSVSSIGKPRPARAGTLAKPHWGDRHRRSLSMNLVASALGVIPAAHVHANNHIGRSVYDRVVGRIDVKINEPARIHSRKLGEVPSARAIWARRRNITCVHRALPDGPLARMDDIGIKPDTFPTIYGWIADRLGLTGRDAILGRSMLSDAPSTHAPRSKAGETSMLQG